MLTAVPGVGGLVVYPRVTGGVPGTIYQLSVQATGATSGVVMQLDAFLAVLPDGL
jgi:hypothetical protein